MSRGTVIPCESLSPVSEVVRLHQAALFRFGHLAHESSRFRVWHDDRIVNLGVEQKYLMGGKTLPDYRSRHSFVPMYYHTFCLVSIIVGVD